MILEFFEKASWAKIAQEISKCKNCSVWTRRLLSQSYGYYKGETVMLS